MSKRDEVAQNTVAEFFMANKGVDTEKMADRAKQMHRFLTQWTKPQDLVCLAVLAGREKILEPMLKEHKTTGPEVQDFLDEIVSGVLHLYALAEGRMEADLERLEKENKAASRLDPERKLQEVKEGGKA